MRGNERKRTRNPEGVEHPLAASQWICIMCPLDRRVFYKCPHRYSAGISKAKFPGTHRRLSVEYIIIFGMDIVWSLLPMHPFHLL
jgi:hypothetical protein